MKQKNITQIFTFCFTFFTIAVFSQQTLKFTSTKLVHKFEINDEPLPNVKVEYEKNDILIDQFNPDKAHGVVMIINQAKSGGYQFNINELISKKFQDKFTTYFFSIVEEGKYIPKTLIMSITNTNSLFYFVIIDDDIDGNKNKRRLISDYQNIEKFN